MSRYYERNDSGYTRGGLDVVTGINLFFKGILIFPILVLATYVGLALMKHMLFQGIPQMNAPSLEQIERIRTQDAQAHLPQADVEEVTQDSHNFEGYGYHSAVADHTPPHSYETQTLVEPQEEAWITTIETSPFE